MVGLMKEYINPLLRVFTVVALISIIIMQDKEIKKLKTFTPRNDSIPQDEVFILRTEKGRYEMTLELLREEDSSAADKFEKILNKETE